MFFRITLISCLAIFIGSCSKDCVRTEVEKNCTGTYLRISEKVYKVCNYEILDAYEDGDEVNARYKKVNNCTPDPDVVICMMYFPFDGNIEVSSIH